MDTENIVRKQLKGNYVIVYKIYDPLGEYEFSETHQVKQKILISIGNDGEFVRSKCYLTSAMTNPICKMIDRDANLNLLRITIEYGDFNNRIETILEVSGIDL